MLELGGNLRQAFGALLLTLEQGVECLLPLTASQLGLLLQRLLGVQGLGQAIEVGLFQMRLLDPWRAFALVGLRLGCRQLRALQFCFKSGLSLAQLGLLLQMGTNLLGQRA